MNKTNNPVHLLPLQFNLRTGQRLAAVLGAEMTAGSKGSDGVMEVKVCVDWMIGCFCSAQNFWGGFWIKRNAVSDPQGLTYVGNSTVKTCFIGLTGLSTGLNYLIINPVCF